jgi:hypothetical protein
MLVLSILIQSFRFGHLSMCPARRGTSGRHEGLRAVQFRFRPAWFDTDAAKLDDPPLDD